ncbi:ATP-binding protein [Nocardioides albus]|uniref:MoxR-like ATPase n=1 Tax=Nocardioides albus TaxID=1841 RepID=A0A7W5F8K1_9ACTN|nr:AAA family ATPase [Nocardioides albus]MBB3089213.1 MoxR-like ATPase [Nocardioides albus]GGU13497.1 ATPase AAA [Nocardioides albus]
MSTDRETQQMTQQSQEQRLPAEVRYADELARLAKADADNGAELPPGWRLSPRAVRAFIVGDSALGVTRKFYGDDPLVDRAVVSLLGRQGLMLVGEPGTAKSMLSELLAAAVSGTSNLTIQGTAGTTEDHVRYSWNYALLIAEGPSERSLVPSAIHTGMSEGKVVRFEEITRCAPEIQDTLVSILSEKQLMVPELGSEVRVAARPGFNIIATANLKDRGVHEMSAALKRRFNFETVAPVRDRDFEIELVERRLTAELGPAGVRPDFSRDVLEVLVTVFADLRVGATKDGTPVKRPETVMSTAEAVNVAIAASLEARYLGDGTVTAAQVARQVAGVASKGEEEDARRMRHYVDNVVRERARRDRRWKDFFDAADPLWR